MTRGARCLISGTEEMYLATTHFGADGGICVTGSHNPMDYNGMKVVRAGSAPLDAGTGPARIKELAEENAVEPCNERGKIRDVAAEARSTYVGRICEFVDVTALKPVKMVLSQSFRLADERSSLARAVPKPAPSCGSATGPCDAGQKTGRFNLIIVPSCRARNQPTN